MCLGIWSERPIPLVLGRSLFSARFASDFGWLGIYRLRTSVASLSRDQLGTSGNHQPGWSEQAHPPHIFETRVTQPTRILWFTVAATSSRSYQHRSEERRLRK